MPGPVDVSLDSPVASAETWRRAAYVTAAIAAAELLLLVGIGVALLGGPVLNALGGRVHPLPRAATSSVPQKRPHGQAPARPLPRDRLTIMVLNGNGETGAAARAAGRLHLLGYRIAGTANATRMNYAMSIVLYRPGYRADGLRLAHELRVHVVGPLDGLRAQALRGGELAVILGR